MIDEIRFFNVRCNTHDCPAQLKPIRLEVADKYDAEKLLKKMGWRVGIEVLLCPTCAAKAAERRP